MLLICGGALLVRPALGTGVQANQGPTPTGFAPRSMSPATR
jgi:hypothetical protein